MNETSDWIPSHVEITIHQARELLLKNKNANSELYVNIQVEKERHTTTFVPRDTAPQWNFVSEIPLMSLDTAIHLTVRQKGRLGDQFIGHIPLLLSNFSISPKQITHWYKLGSRPGKVKNKLRGDLQVSIRFLSNWSSSLSNAKPKIEEEEREAVFGPSGGRRHFSNGIISATSSGVGGGNGSRGSKHLVSRRMLTRSKSEMRIKVRDVMATNPIDGKPTTPQPKVKERLATAIRRSFRRKNKTPVLVFQQCEDDFTFSHSASSTPVLRKRSNTISSLLKGAQSDSDSLTPSDASQSPAMVHPSIRVQSSSTRESESSGDNNEDGTSTEERNLRDRKTEWVRGSKRRWTMNTLPLSIPPTTPTSSSSIHVLGVSPSPSPSAAPSESSRCPTEDGATPQNTELNEEDLSTYRAKTNNIAISPHQARRGYDRQRSYSITSSQASLKSAHFVEQESISESRSGATSPLSSSKKNLNAGESGYNTGTSCLDANVVRHSPMEEESSSEVGSKTSEQTQTSQKTPTTSKGNSSTATGRDSATKTTTTPKRPRQLTRRNTSAAVSRPRGTTHQTRARLESHGSGSGGGNSDASRKGKALSERGANNPTKKKALSPPSTPTRRLLPATPIRRSEKAHLAATATRPKSMTITLSELATEGKGVATKDTSSSSTKADQSLVDGNDRSSLDNPAKVNDAPSSSRSDGNSREEIETSTDAQTSMMGVTATERKTKHTVAYKDTSPLYKDGFQPVSLLPPSMTDYQSQTLPLRGKQARRRSTETNLARKFENTTDREPTLLRGSSAQRIDRTPPNTKLVHRSSMNYVMGGAHQTKTPPFCGVSGAPLLSSGGLEETDFASVGEIPAVVDGCSKSSITSFSSTSTSSRPSTPSASAARTPGEIVASALRNRSRPSGVLRKAIGMYQENKRQSLQVRKTLQENKCHSSFMEELEEREDMENDDLNVPEMKKRERVSSSAGNSPQLRRNRSAAETLTGLLKNPFGSLRRSVSNVAGSKSSTSSSSASRPLSMLEMGGDLGISPDLLERLRTSQTSRSHTSLITEDHSSPSSQHLQEQLQKTSAPALMAFRCKSATSAKNDREESTQVVKSDSSANNSNSKFHEPIIRVRTPSMTESSSVKTLTEMDSSLRENASSPGNPARASPTMTSSIIAGHSRHTTCSSVDSEGFVSVTSEELNMEDFYHQQDLSQLSKEDLFKELVMTKQALRRKDQELQDIKGYLDNLLLRIMETNPSILSSSSST